MQCPACALECPPDATICPRCTSDLVEPPSYTDPRPLQWTVISSPDRSSAVPRWVLVVVGVVLLALLGTGIGYAVGRGGPTSGAGSPAGAPAHTPAGQPASPARAASPTQPTQPTPQSPAAASPSSGDAVRQQATAMDQLITSTKATRGKLGDALNNVDQCQDLASAASVLDAVAAERQTEISLLESLAVDALPDGASMRGVLVQALDFSIEADHGYADWARALMNGCVAPAAHDGNWQQADAASQQATDAKRRFLIAWNPVAASNGLPTRVDTDL
jgi:hypothetical protein